LTRRNNNFVYPYKIAFQLPEGSTGHIVVVKVVESKNEYKTKGVRQTDGSYVVTIEEQPDFLLAGSADVKIFALNECGERTKAASYTICDNELTPGAVLFKGPNAPSKRGDKMAFSWASPKH